MYVCVCNNRGEKKRDRGSGVTLIIIYFIDT